MSKLIQTSPVAANLDFSNAGLGAFDTSEYKLIEVKKNGKIIPVKQAYGRIYEVDEPDFEIELDQIRRLEPFVYRRKLGKDLRETANEFMGYVAGIDKLAFHYKQICRLWFPELSLGWNQWSEEILYLFLQKQIHKVLWGSGACGKSALFAFCKYVKYRVNPEGRLILILSRYSTDSHSRVYGYISKYHREAPASQYHMIEATNANSKYGEGIRTYTCLLYTSPSPRDKRQSRMPSSA